MSACEQCWNAAYTKSRMLGGTQVEWYYRLLEENTEHGEKG
jgi:hypothetical protein